MYRLPLSSVSFIQSLSTVVPCSIIHHSLFFSVLSVSSVSHLFGFPHPRSIVTPILSLTSPLRARLLCLSPLSRLSLLPCHLHCVIFCHSRHRFLYIHLWSFGRKNRLVHWSLHQTAVRGDLSYQQWSVYMLCLYVPAGQRVCVPDRVREKLWKQRKHGTLKRDREKYAIGVWCWRCYRLNVVLFFFLSTLWIL